MQSSRHLKTIVRNLITLYLSGRFEDQLTYQRILDHGLNRFDLVAVKQAFQYHINHRHVRSV